MDILSGTARGAQDRQLTQYLIIPGKNGRYSKFTENSPIGMSQTYGFVLPRHKMAKIMVQYGRPQSVPLERNLFGHPSAGLVWKKAI